jgi:hypothetical protein
MNTTHKIKTKRVVTALGVAAAAAVAPALLFAGAGTAQADDPCYGSLQGSYYCSPASGISPQTPELPAYAPVQPAFGYNALPQCSGGVLTALDGEC